MAVADILDLVIAQRGMLEARRRAREVEHPHAVEAFVIHGDDRIAVGLAALVPFAQCLCVVDAQHLHVGCHQAHLLARRHGLAQRRGVTAGENVLVGELVGRAGPVYPPDSVQQHHPVVLHQVDAGAEESFELRHADMLEHADRDDPVEAVASRGEIAIVDQLELHAVGDASGGGAFFGQRKLLLREGNAMHRHIGASGEEDRHAAPATANVEYGLAGLQRKLGSDMGQLGLLRLLQRHSLFGPVGAAILHVILVEHQPVKIVSDVVVMRDIPARG